MPSRNAVAERETASGVEPYWRPYRPIGSLAVPISLGTVSVTGARLTLMPAALSSLRPGRGLAGQLGRRHLRLHLGRGRAGEALPAQLVHLAALLVGGDEQPDVARGVGRTRSCRCEDVRVTLSAPSQPPR